MTAGQRRYRYSLRKFLLTATALLLLIGVGCIVLPTKLPNRKIGTAGARLYSADVDLAFIKIGVTHRDEVTTKLAAIDVGSPAQFFWGRWAESSWGVVAGAVTGSDPSEIYGGSGRHWHLHNVLVKFDDHGIAEETRTIDDDEALWHQLLAYSRALRPAPASDTVRVASIEKKYTEMSLAPESLQFRGAKQKNNVIVNFPSPIVVRLRPHYQRQPADQTGQVCYRLEVNKTNAGSGEKFEFCATAQQFLEILAYLDHLPAPARLEGK